MSTSNNDRPETLNGQLVTESQAVPPRKARQPTSDDLGRLPLAVMVALLQAIRRYKAANPPSDPDKCLWPLDDLLPFLDADTAQQVVTWTRGLLAGVVPGCG
jgi:hypothetical protein